MLTGYSSAEHRVGLGSFVRSGRSLLYVLYGRWGEREASLVRECVEYTNIKARRGLSAGRESGGALQLCSL